MRPGQAADAAGGAARELAASRGGGWGLLDALELAIGFGLVPLVDGASGRFAAAPGRPRSAARSRGELGIVIPPVRIHDELGMESHEYVLKVRGSEVTRGRIMPGHLLAMDPGDAAGTLQGIPTREPAFGLAAMWVHESGRGEAEALGYTVVDAESVIVTHLTETIRTHASELLTRQDVRDAAGPAEGDQRRGRRGGRARGSLARRDPAGAATRCSPRVSRSAISARSWRRSATRRE